MPANPILHGLHHVTAVTGDARANLDFYTRLLGMRLVKKTVNQDDVSAYHLFYADGLGSPGTELTFFDWRTAPRARPGAGTVSETALRVTGGLEALGVWSRWFTENGVNHGPLERGSGSELPSLPFQDPDGQRLRLVAEPGVGGADGGDGSEPPRFHPWKGSPVPPGFSVVGLSAVNLAVREFEPTARFLTDVLGFRASAGDPTLFETGPGGPGARLRLLVSTAAAIRGAGGVHHVAWRVNDTGEQQLWLSHLNSHGLTTSGLIDRFYFQSLYFRIPGGILFEIATDGPGFTADGEDPEHLGERLSLPPFLERIRGQIETGLEPLGNPPAPRVP